MRSKKTIINTICGLIEELVVIIASFIIPRLILSKFGSTYNGLANSITQFLSYAVLLRAGIGSATRAALYKPIANNDKDEMNSVVKATDIYMKKIGLILLVTIIIFSLIYPLFVRDEFDYIFSLVLFIIIGIGAFIESFFGITYLIVLQADQKNYIASIFRIISYALELVVSYVLIVCTNSIHIIKLGSALAICVYPIGINLYVKKKYKIDKNVKPNNKAIAQRWDAFWHQVAAFINNNTDVMVLTIFTNMLEVSVYSVYNLVISGIKRTIASFTSGFEYAFGNMIAKNETKNLEEGFSLVEMIMFNLSTFIFSGAILLILQFVQIYTYGVTDVDYSRPMFAYLLLAAQFLYAIRLPYQFIVNADGKFAETKKYAIFEAIINIALSVVLVIKFGLIGVAIGTLIALLYKTTTFSNYVSRNIIIRSRLVTLKKCLISIVEFLIIFAIMNFIKLPIELNYLNWIFNGIITALVSGVIVFIGIIIFYRNDFNNFIIKIKNLLNNKKTNRKGI